MKSQLINNHPLGLKLKLDAGGRITLPLAFRESNGLRNGDYVAIVPYLNHAIIKPASDNDKTTTRNSARPTS